MRLNECVEARPGGDSPFFSFPLSVEQRATTPNLPHLPAVRAAQPRLSRTRL